MMPRAGVGDGPNGSADRDLFVMPPAALRAHRRLVAREFVLAEDLPSLYRAALDAVDELTRRGRRAEAARLRAMAIRAYSRAWDDGCRRALEDVIRRARATDASGAPARQAVAAPPNA